MPGPDPRTRSTATGTKRMGDPLRDGKKGTSTRDPSKEDRERGGKKLPKEPDSPNTVEKAKEPKSPTERMNEKKAQTREQRLALTDIGMAKGGRAMYKSGMRVCKLAKRGKGRAYGKNS